MPTVFVGETRLPKNFKRYASQFPLLELDCEPGTVPGKARLEACAAAAPKGFVFSLVVPSRLASLEVDSETDAAWKAAQNAANILKASWWVVRTPASVRPTRQARAALGALFARLADQGRRVAWEPRGLWDDAAAAGTAQELGVYLVQDIAREVPLPNEVLYTRLLALGKGARVGLGLADVVAERVLGFEQAFVVVEGRGAREIQQALGLAQAELGPESVDEEDEEDEGPPESAEVEVS